MPHCASKFRHSEFKSTQRKDSLRDPFDLVRVHRATYGTVCNVILTDPRCLHRCLDIREYADSFIGPHTHTYNNGVTIKHKQIPINFLHYYDYAKKNVLLIGNVNHAHSTPHFVMILNYFRFLSFWLVTTFHLNIYFCGTREPKTQQNNPYQYLSSYLHVFVYSWNFVEWNDIVISPLFMLRPSHAADNMSIANVANNSALDNLFLLWVKIIWRENHRNINSLL